MSANFHDVIVLIGYIMAAILTFRQFYGYIPFAIECKNQERLNIWKALKQARENASSLGPLVVFTRNGQGLFAAIDWGDLLYMCGQIAELKAEVEQLEDQRAM